MKRVEQSSSRLAAIVLAVSLLACTEGNSAGTSDPGLAGDPELAESFIEPVRQRSPFGNFLAGQLAERERDFDRAATALVRALDENPDNLALLRQTFYVSLEAGQIRTALRLARRLDETNLDVPIAQLLLAAESTRRGEYEAALRWLEPMDRASDLARLSVPLALAWTHVGAQQHDAALQAVSSLDAAAGFALLQVLHEGFIHDVTGRPDQAEIGYRQALSIGSAEPPVRVVR